MIIIPGAIFTANLLIVLSIPIDLGLSTPVMLESGEVTCQMRCFNF